MPELGEVAHMAHLLTRYAKGKIVTAFSIDTADTIVFPAIVPTAKYVNQTITDVGRHGKYFWFALTTNHSAVDIVLMHFGMTGWISFNTDVDSHFFPMERSVNGKRPETYADPAKAQWPPKYTKFEVSLGNDLKFAFTDPRRLARVRFIDGIEGNIEEEAKKLEPLCRTGTDFSKPDRLSEEQFTEILEKRKVPVKALLLDQAVCTGVGNWMADEILFQARIHPMQRGNTLSPETKSLLYKCLCEVCELTVKLEADSSKFPESWLMTYRWSKRKKSDDRQTTADGYTVDFLTVGGRTSCFVPELQVYTGDDSLALQSPKSKDASKSKQPKEPKKEQESKKKMNEAQKEKRENKRKINEDIKTKDEMIRNGRVTRSRAKR
ncbi:Formamidopyrimidine-DNA glycosylase N-terminal domain-containing protein [Lipomyces arxii]|uniref:Formamidopyrimidine-DNA glycosylase N-terminal domain-containing protein n=1 Tax=Lipomyces arxii TaxID=56418 RepID=UPI0034CE6E04